MADNNTNLKRKRPKAFYVGQKKKKKGQEHLTPGMKGVLVTCNERENLCVREAYNVLNEYADQLYGPEHSLQGDDTTNGSDSEDIEEALAKEVKELQGTKHEKRLQSVLSGAVNVIFIKTNLPDSKDPTDLVHTILTDMLKTACKKTRHCQRFLPIAGSCHANKEDIKKLAEQMFQSTFFAEDAKPSTFCVIYKSRNNSSITRDDAIATLAGIVMNAGKGHTVNLSKPDLAICVEIIKNVCCMSVVKDLFKLRKYNIHEVNEQIFQSQKNSAKLKEDNGVDPSIEKTNDNTQDISTTDSTTTVDNTNTGDLIVIKECQEKSEDVLNETGTVIDSSVKEVRNDAEKDETIT
ncbi:THUMP domain-containing protein 1 [Desmophyllum pertusum]|uniref:THUMP domain-containing protein 1 n=1 Tax=Desmophyllum pertusum TaxID=174260 RepID=A0A9W9ZLW5_9CNID|nr:THUMP domain-containing protein 1 [Desmophyllum pertusum]